MFNLLKEINDSGVKPCLVVSENKVLEKNSAFNAIGNNDLYQDFLLDLLEKQRQLCILDINKAVEKYHHPGMGSEELKTIVVNVITKKASVPDITESARLFLSQDG